jgi:hypothetical protein
MAKFVAFGGADFERLSHYTGAGLSAAAPLEIQKTPPERFSKAKFRRFRHA